MTLMRLQIQARKFIKTSNVYLYVKRAKYSYARLNCFYCFHMHDRVYFLKNYQAHKLFQDALYIPGGGEYERIALTDVL